MTRKLIDDCFRTDPRDGQRLTHERTLGLIRERVQPVVVRETVQLDGARGRISAADLAAPFAVPGHTNAAVDGYAFVGSQYDAGEGSRFRIGGRITAGGTVVSAQKETALRVFTGAVVPEPYDTVAMQEECEVNEAGVFVPGGLKRGANVRKAGEDVEAGAVVVRAGEVIRAPEIAALASFGIGEAPVFARAKVGLIATGDEVRRGGQLAHGEVYDVNTPLITALLSGANADLVDLGVWPDRRDEVVGRLQAAEAAGFDLLITSGGASQGEEDHISHALAALGQRHFWQIAVKPGRPLMLGQVGGTALVGLPGNPVAVFVCCLMYVMPLIRQLSGARWREPRRFPLPASFSVPGRKTGRREFWRGTMRVTDEGPVVDKFPRDGSGLISGLRAANGLIDIGEAVAHVEAGQMVDFIPFSEFGILD